MSTPTKAGQPGTQPPPEAMVLDLLLAKWTSIAISTAAKLGVADKLEAGPRSAAEIAAELGVNPEALYRLMRTTASVGIFEEQPGGRFRQTELSDTLRSDSPHTIRSMAMMLIDGWHHASWGELPWCVETGRPASFKLYGKHIFEKAAEEPELAVNFNNAMTELSRGQAEAITDAYDFSGFKHVVDAGGGHGTLLARILQSAPELRGTLFDMPYVIEQARSGPILEAVRDRCDFAAGSFFEGPLPAADAFIMKYIIHDWDDAQCTGLLKHCRESIQPGGRLLVVDQVVPAGNGPSMSKIIDLEMLVMPGGKERTEKEFAALFAGAGFRLERVIPTSGPMCILEGSPV